MTHSDFMLEALKEADAALQCDEMPVGCVIVQNGKIISQAHNERESLQDPTAHAEILAIRRAAKVLNSWRLDDCDMYVTLEPCPMCAGAISQARLRNLIYAAEDKAYGCAGSIYRIPEDPAFNHFCHTTGGLLHDRAEAQINRFFAKRRNGVPSQNNV